MLTQGTKQKSPLVNTHRRVLVVDDSMAIHEDFRKILIQKAIVGEDFEASLFGETAPADEDFQFQVEFASQGQEALAMIQRALVEKSPYAMAFMDIRMPPGWDGVETTLKIWEVYPEVQIVICTAYSDYSWDEMIGKLGRSDRLVILKKPFDCVEVRQLANSLTEKWLLLQQTRLTVADLESTVRERTQALQASHEEMEMLLASITAVIIGLDADQKVTRWNHAAEFLFGIPPEQALGQSIDLLNGKMNWKLVQESLNHCLIFRVPIELTALPYRRADGKDGFLNLTLTPSRSGDNPHLAIILLGTDTTSRHQLESQLRQAQKLEVIGQLAAGIAHEINTPTQYIGDNTRFLKDSFGSIGTLLQTHKDLLHAAKNNTLTAALVKQVEESLVNNDLEYLFSQIPAAISETLEGVDRVAKIVRAMKEFSHPGGKEKAPSDLNKAIETTITVAHNEWKYVADMELELDPQLPVVPCFIGDFNQCVLNLIVNAAHAIGDVIAKNPGTKGKITVQTRNEVNEAEVRIIDTGTGIPESARPKIFEPFFTTKDVGKGTGQGLYLAYQTIVEKHQGTIRFETELGRGTTFIIRLPFHPPTSPAKLVGGEH
jgi:PAS domain S-box-containing protein